MFCSNKRDRDRYNLAKPGFNIPKLTVILCLEPSYYGIAVGLDYGRHRSKGSLGPDPSYFQEIFPRDLPVESKLIYN